MPRTGFRCTSRSAANRNVSATLHGTCCDSSAARLALQRIETARGAAGRGMRLLGFRCTSRSAANRNILQIAARIMASLGFRCTSRSAANRNSCRPRSHDLLLGSAARLALQRIETSRVYGAMASVLCSAARLALQRIETLSGCALPGELRKFRCTSRSAANRNSTKRGRPRARSSTGQFRCTSRSAANRNLALTRTGSGLGVPLHVSLCSE